MSLGTTARLLKMVMSSVKVRKVATIVKDGHLVGEVRQDGTIVKDGHLVGEVRGDGTVLKEGHVLSDVKGKEAAITYFFFDN